VSGSKWNKRMYLCSVPYLITEPFLSLTRCIPSCFEQHVFLIARPGGDTFADLLFGSQHSAIGSCHPGQPAPEQETLPTYCKRIR
jgi:hypothetical protein